MHRRAVPSRSTGYKYVDNEFFFLSSCCQDQKHGCQVSIRFCFPIFFPISSFYMLFVRRALVKEHSSVCLK